MTKRSIPGFGDVNVTPVDKGLIDCSDVAIQYSPRSVRYPGGILGAVFAHAALNQPARVAAGNAIFVNHEAGRRLQLHDVSSQQEPVSPKCLLARFALNGSLGISEQDVRDNLGYTQHLSGYGWVIPEPDELRKSFKPDGIVVVDSDEYTVVPADPDQTLLRVDRSVYHEAVLKPTAPDDQAAADLIGIANRQIDALMEALPDIPRYDISL